MPLSKNINTYADIAEILAAALPHRQITYDAGTRGKAVRFMQRCYQYRLLLQQAERAKMNVKGVQPPTPYDRMKLNYDPQYSNRVLIDFEPRPTGEFILPSGERIPAALSEAIPVPGPEAVPLTLAQPMTDKDESLLDALRGIVGGDE